MAVDADMTVWLFVKDENYTPEIEEWSGEKVSPHHMDGRPSVMFDYNWAGWEERAIERLEDDLKELVGEHGVPVTAFECDVWYVNRDELGDSGDQCSFKVVDGKMTEFEVSKMTMVPAEPLRSLDVTGGE